jgi:inner membrane protein
MFNSTHTLVGFAVARIGVEKWAPYATATAVIAANLPDIDSVAGFWGTAAYLDHHRGVTHSMVGVPLLSLILAAVMYFFSGNFWKTYAVALIAMATHPALDYLNPYGLRPFLPFSAKWYYGDALFILDPYIDMALLAGLTVGWLSPTRRRVAAMASIAVVSIYVGLRFELHATVLKNAHAVRAEELAAVPIALDPLRWDLFASTKEGVTKFETCSPSFECADMMLVRTTSPNEAVVKAAATRTGEAFFRFARFPVVNVDRTASGYRVTFFDMRFYRETGNAVFGSEVELDRSLNIIRIEDLITLPIAPFVSKDALP